MSIKVSCDGCGKTYQVDDRFAGKKAKCKACGQGMQVPGARVPANASPPAAKSTLKTSAPSSPKAVTKSSRKPVTSDGTDGEFDFSALDDVERSGAIDHSYQAPAMIAAPPEKARSASAKGTTFADAKARNTPAGKVKVVEGPKTFAESMIPGVMGYVFIALMVIGIVGLANEKLGGMVALGLGALGILFCVFAKLRTLSMARDEGFGTYLMYRFVPFYSFYYVCTRWDDAGDSVLSWMKGATMLVLAFILLVRAGGIDQVLGRKVDASDGVSMKSRNVAKAPEAQSEDDMVFPEGSTMSERVAARRAARLQADKDAVGAHDVEPNLLPVRTEFPELGDPEEHGMTAYVIALNGQFQGEPSNLTLYVPNGPHADHSLPCVLLSASKEDPLEGRTITENEINEAGVFIRGGFAVMLYSTSRWAFNARPRNVTSCVTEFIQSDGGMHFARSAVNFLAAKAVMIDMNRLYAVGQGGSATIALNLAAIDPRIRAVATFSPVCDVAQEIGMPLEDVELRVKLNGIEAFTKRTSPVNRVSELQCPVLVLTGGEYGNSDEASARASGIKAFTAAMQAARKSITVAAVKGEKIRNYDLDVVMPQMLEWLKSLPATSVPAGGRRR